MTTPNCLTLVLLLAAAGLGACSPSETATTGEIAPVNAHSPLPTGGAGLTFTAPEEWVQETPSSSMRKAQYRLPRVPGDDEDAEMVVFYFQGQGGSVQANVDRWIGQFRKSDGSPASDSARTERRVAHDIPLTIVDVSGTYTGAGGPMMAAAAPKPGYRMLAAVAETESGPWFFKLTGPIETVNRWEKSFHDFLTTLKP